MDLDDLAKFARAAHDPSLADQEGMVHMVFQDFELAVQKSGPLLWQRTLHVIRAGLPGKAYEMPVKLDPHSYAFISEEAYYTIKQALDKLGQPA